MQKHTYSSNLISLTRKHLTPMAFLKIIWFTQWIKRNPLAIRCLLIGPSLLSIMFNSLQAESRLIHGFKNTMTKMLNSSIKCNPQVIIILPKKRKHSNKNKKMTRKNGWKKKRKHRFKLQLKKLKGLKMKQKKKNRKQKVIRMKKKFNKQSKKLNKQQKLWMKILQE